MKKKAYIWIGVMLALSIAAGVWTLLRAPEPALLEAARDTPELQDGMAELLDEGIPLGEASAEDPFAAFTEEQKTAMNEVLSLVNAARQEAGVAPLTLSPVLCTAAQVRAGECVTNFSHTRPDGTSYKTAITALGVAPGYSGENAATGHTTPQMVVGRWLQSEGHRANILNPNYTQIGVGLAPNVGNGYKGYSWVQLFTS